MKTKKAKAAGRFGIRHGIRVRKKLNEVEAKQRVRQICPFCKKQKVKRIAKGIWNCSCCGKRFASDTFYLQ